jgi:hypothetical protein
MTGTYMELVPDGGACGRIKGSHISVVALDVSSCRT